MQYCHVWTRTQGALPTWNHQSSYIQSIFPGCWLPQQDSLFCFSVTDKLLATCLPTCLCFFWISVLTRSTLSTHSPSRMLTQPFPLLPEPYSLHLPSKTQIQSFPRLSVFASLTPFLTTLSICPHFRYFRSSHSFLVTIFHIYCMFSNKDRERTILLFHVFESTLGSTSTYWPLSPHDKCLFCFCLNDSVLK